MTDKPTIRLLEPASNARGDLFTRLSQDVFSALGYQDFRLNVHKSGRELDLQGTHRVEDRHVRAECKATADTIGGADINKFRGAVAVDRDSLKGGALEAYFLSVGGFKETAVEQEQSARGANRVILLDGPRVVEELVRGNVVVGQAGAAERAGRCAQRAGIAGLQFAHAELLGHEVGYVWAIRYSQGKAPTHFALVHADGTPLASGVAGVLTEADQACGGFFHTLRYLAPAEPDPGALTSALARYRAWVKQECGYVYLDGLPVDADLGSKKLDLVELFVPVRVIPHPRVDFIHVSHHGSDHLGDVAATLPEANLTEEQVDAIRFVESGSVHVDGMGVLGEALAALKPRPVGALLAGRRHVALLAAPGGGKSTLLKRLTLAYAFPDLRGAVSPELPERDQLPLLLRCRDLRDRAGRPMLELLDELPRRAEMTPPETDAFREHVQAALRAGAALVLVDGLDEISEEGLRMAFAKTLRGFVATYPAVGLVVTSREAGFRAVAGALADSCGRATLAPLGDDDVRSLCERWHLAVEGDRPEVKSKAAALAGAVLGNDRIKALAQNPLLLTTIFVVKRAVGELPQSRATLYGEAVKVLVRTWNVEGHDPLDLDEALAQLYVACDMMERGVQSVGRGELLRLLTDARRVLEAELQASRLTPAQFVERLEYRSSLLMQTGHREIDGQLQEVFEFRHLTFQEYLAARGYVNEQHSRRAEDLSLTQLLTDRVGNVLWSEVVPLAAVLAGHKAEAMLKWLAQCARTARLGGTAVAQLTLRIQLRRCLADGVQATAATLGAAMSEAARDPSLRPAMERGHMLAELALGKYAGKFREAAETGYLSGDQGWQDYLAAMAVLARVKVFVPPGSAQGGGGTIGDLIEPLTGQDRATRVRAALALANLSFFTGQTGLVADADLSPIRDALVAMLATNDAPAAVASCQALAIGPVFPPWTATPELLASLVRLVRESDDVLGGAASHAFLRQRLIPRDSVPAQDWWGCEDGWLRDEVEKKETTDPRVALVVAWYLRRPWADQELAEMVRRFTLPENARLGAFEELHRWATDVSPAPESEGDAG